MAKSKKQSFEELYDNTQEFLQNLVQNFEDSNQLIKQLNEELKRVQKLPEGKLDDVYIESPCLSYESVILSKNTYSSLIKNALDNELKTLDKINKEITEIHKLISEF